jgi:hypothetical protein
MSDDTTLVESDRLKSAWINDFTRVILFRDVASARHYSAPESEFWPYILKLANQGYRLG